MLFAVDFLGKSATVAGLLAACIAVGGFAAAAYPALTGASDDRVRRLTLLGGLFGIAAALGVVFLSAII